MVILNVANGDIDLGRYTINSDMALNSVELLSAYYKIVPGIVNAGYHSFHIQNIGGYIALGLTFFNSRILHISINNTDAADSPWCITEPKRVSPMALLESLGGENIYRWGRVFTTKMIRPA